MRVLILCLGLIATVAQAQVPPGPGPGAATPPMVTPTAPSSMPVAARPALTRYGVLFDVALPDGLALSFAYRPHWAVRLSLGGTYNLLAPGIRVGVAAVPFQWAVTPSLSLDAGHVFAADVGKVISGSTSIPKGVDPLLKSVSYNYADLLLGLEFGSQRRFNFYVKLGLSRVWASASGTGQVSTGNYTTTVKDPAVNLGIPSVKLGFILWVG
jgi:hypothetical protein